MSKVGAFSSSHEFITSFKSHVNDLINNRKSNDKYIEDPTNETKMTKLKLKLDTWVSNYISSKYGGIDWVPSEEEVNEFWYTLDECYSRKLNWQEWNKEEFGPVVYPVGHQKHIPKKNPTDPYKAEEYLGYSNVLEESRLLTQKSLIQHRYREEPPCVKWRLNRVKQGDKIAYIGDAVINQIEAVSSVPWLDAGNESQWFANRASNPKKLRDQWQRVVSISRIREISNFVNNAQNSMFNPVTLFADISDPNISLDPLNDGTYELKVCFDFLQTDEGTDSLTDYLPEPHEKDHRPLWIVDGQHRIRGCSLSHRGFEYRIPIVVLVSEKDNSDGSRRDVAKIFTEINTLSEEIEEKHQYFLKYRFGIKRSKDDDFSIEPGTRTATSLGDPSKENNSKSRSNRRSYELALHLSKNQNSALHNSICFLGEGRNIPPTNIVDIIYWMKYVPSWFQGSGIYSEENSDEFFLEEVNNYYLAFCEMANKSDWPCGLKRDKNNSGWSDYRPRWNIPANRESAKPLCQHSGGFISITEVFPHLIEKMLAENREDEDRPISKKKFRQFLESTSISNLDWRNREFKDKYGGRGPNVTSLKNFLKTCIDEKVKYSEDEVMANDKHSIPGMGILSVPKKTPISFHTGVKWPSGSDVVLRMDRPVHSNSPFWTAEVFSEGKSDPQEFEIQKRWIKTDKNQSLLTIGALDLSAAFPNDFPVKIKIQGYWKNVIGPGTTSEQILEREE